MKTDPNFYGSNFWVLAKIFAAVWLVLTGAPFLFQLLATFKSQGEFISNGIFQLPKSVYFRNYITIIQGGFYRYFSNSLFVLAVSLVLLLFISSFAAYPLSRLKFKLNKPIFSAIVATMSIPIHITLIPVFMMTIRLKMYDHAYALIGPNVAFNLPISIFIMTSFMQGISKEMEEAADIDGCGKFSIFFKIFLPLSKSGLATLAIYNGVVIWNEFVFAMVLTQSQSVRTLPLAIWEYQGQYSINTPLIMTLLVLSCLPVVLLYLFSQDKLVKGMMAGAVKG